jgi:type 1 glutamine amidotransferase
MTTSRRLLAAAFLAFAGLAATVHAAAPLRVLYFTKSAGYEHSVIKRADGQPSYSEKILAALGPKHGIEFTFSKDGSLFSPEYLAQFDVFLFYTTGDLLSVGTDGQPAMSAAGKRALLDAIAGGKGFAAIHSGSDTFHTGESGGGNPPADKRGGRFENHGPNSDSYLRMLGGEFIRHGKLQVARARVIDPKFPGCAALGAHIECIEEWYTLKDFTPDLHALLVMETRGMEGEDYQRPDYPLAWARAYGRGRVWFNAMGHREDVWDSAGFQAMLIGGLEWAGGRVQADITPNLAVEAPGHETIQAPPAPKTP